MMKHNRASGSRFGIVERRKVQGGRLYLTGEDWRETMRHIREISIVTEELKMTATM
jgi:hypothetical protein